MRELPTGYVSRLARLLRLDLGRIAVTMAEWYRCLRGIDRGAMRILQLADETRFATMTTEQLRATFLIDDLFDHDAVSLRYIDLDRTIVGSAVPATKTLVLNTDDALKADYFTERRELGVLNIGGPGSVTVEGERFSLESLDALYIGRGNRRIEFASADLKLTAEFYLLSYPAHAAHPTRQVKTAQVNGTVLGSAETANRREIKRLIHTGGPASCQLVMGFTRLASGSVWNTMPPHTHMRRSEVYLYFSLVPADRVVHLMGPAHQTRNLIVANRQAVVSPCWSIHAGVGTAPYSFCWGMGGENQDYDDMDRLQVADLL